MHPLARQKKSESQAGQMMLIVIVILSFMSFMLGALLMRTGSQVALHRNSVRKEQALNIAEAGLEMAIWKLNNQPGYNGESNTLFGNGAFDILIENVSSSVKKIDATSYVPTKEKAAVKKTISAQAGLSSHVVAFHYGVQTGNGGFIMAGNGTTVNGSVYANGNIQATNITGSAIAAMPSAVLDQSNNNPIPPINTIIFGNSSAAEDFAQSFKISQTYSFNKIQLYIKKIGSPANATVRILYDNNGSPGEAIDGLTGTLSASQVFSDYSWVDVSLPVSPILNEKTTYWLVIDAASNASKYYILGANNNGYGNGFGKSGKYGGTWNDLSPASLDGYFQIYLGGQLSSITGGAIGQTSNDIAWANAISNATVSGTIYCQTGSRNNKACNTSRSDPSPQPLPLSDSDIQNWKNEALAGGIVNGDVVISSNTAMGPTKINGNLSISGSSALTVTGTIWVTGNLSLSGGSTIRLDASYGANDGVILTDGYDNLAGNSQFYGSGQAGSYPFLITTSSCPISQNCDERNAISFSGGSGTVGLVAQNGTISIAGGSGLKAVTAKTITMSGGSQLIYDSGLVNANFSSGPGGSWNFISGTYLIIN